ncbi:solute carrier family 22 member 4-like [Gigantopelta aegis]|uniref:solute carrier family 22 member 4-like n=1 Tax=Gigantopelta aegis TaxID=1735272 RepID=UPI001B88B393|nr:solute carrier family 22 member 4-like [Gigantopelta aegis]
MHIENLIDELGGFGRFQRLFVLFLSTMKIPISWSLLMMAFAGIEPDWFCLSRDASSNWTSTNETAGKCLKNTSICGIRKFDEEMITAVSQWGLVCEKRWITGFIIAVQMGGVLLGAVVAGQVAGAYGRKNVIVAAIVVTCIGNVVSVFSTSWVMFTGLRVVLGVAAGAMQAINYIYQLEFVNRKWRVGLVVIPAFPVGVILACLMFWLSPNFIHLHIAGAVISLPYVIGCFFMPESIRWLAVKGRVSEAKALVTRIARINGRPEPDTTILEKIAAEEQRNHAMLMTYSYLDLFRTRQLVKTTLILCFSWASSSIVFYAISFGVADLSGNFYVNMLLMQVTEFPALMLVVVITSCIGRRWTCAVAFCGTSVSCFVLAIAVVYVPSEIEGVLITVLAILAKSLLIIAWHGLEVFSAEQYPTVLRNLGMSACSSGARVGGIISSQVLALGQGRDLMAPYLVMGVVSFVTGAVCLLLRETKGEALEDTLTRVKTETVAEDYELQTPLTT